MMMSLIFGIELQTESERETAAFVLSVKSLSGLHMLLPDLVRSSYDIPGKL